jgi:short-subunit dehydrogenase
MLGLYAIPSAGAYTASKHALIGLCDTLRAEVHRHGIEVTALCPGLVGSDIIKNGRMKTDGMERSRLDRIWQTRGATPDQIGKIAVRCVEKRKGGVQLAAPTGRVLYDLRRFAPSLYARVLSIAARLASSDGLGERA